ncbi:MAG: gliding motility-associated C-terminal domain-containing protein [Lewinella sp.]|nr:gliding motility-associated C-terminal domain-containing protein [Lewinella sp.]
MRFFPFLLLFLMFAGPLGLRATHIVGGEMNYTCLGNDQYEITLTVYRDCFYGDPNAYFDDPASIGIFDVNHILIQQILVPLMGDDTLAPVLTDECLVVPPDVCVHTTTYSTTVVLPPIIGGYQLAYQRCCRNQTIANIVDPLATGATFGVTISEQALLECNSSPQFVAWPPLYICANEPIIFDQSAVDADGDSIVYRLCTPLTGATPEIPRPQPPNNPPYAEVTWQDPPYDVNNMLNGTPGDPPLAIDPFTGLLTGTPNTIGQFVVGICLEEYRDGVLISTTRRDFQYNVGVCGQTAAAFFAPEIQCDDLTVAFDNDSQGANIFFWDFGVAGDPNAISSEVNPTYTFPDTGTYTVTLIAAPVSVCADTFQQTIHLTQSGLVPDFQLDTLSCGDVLMLQAQDLTIDTLAGVVSQQWLVNGNLVAEGGAPTLTFTQPGFVTLTLLVTSSNGCTATATQEFFVQLVQEGLPGDTLYICPGGTAALNPSFNPTYTYNWAPVDYLNDPMAPNPVASPPVTTDYQLTVTDPTSGCFIEKAITVAVAPPLVTDVGPDFILTCDPVVSLTAQSNTGIQYLWADNLNFFPVLSDTPDLEVSPFTSTTYYVLVRDIAGCLDTASVTVYSRGVNVISPQDTFLCVGSSLSLQVPNLDPNDNLTFQWAPSPLIQGPTNTDSIQLQAHEPGVFPVSFTITNQLGCSLTDTLQVLAVDTLAAATELVYDQCGDFQIRLTASGLNASLLNWDFGDPAAPNATATGAHASHSYAGPGTYTVTASLPDFLPCAQAISIPVTVSAEGLIADFSWEYSTCSDTASISFTDGSSYDTAPIIDWQWQIGEDHYSGTSVELTLAESSALPVTLIIAAGNGCMDTLATEVEIPLVELALPDSLLVCPGLSVPLNPGGSSDYTYQWSNGQWLDDDMAVNPVASPPQPAVFAVTVSDPNSICQRVGEVPVFVPPVIDYTLSPDTAVCVDEWLLSVSSEQAVGFVWSASANFTSVLSSSTDLLAPVSPGSVFYVRLQDAYGCTVVDQVTVDNQGIQVILPTATTVCIGDTLSLQVFTDGPFPAISYAWSPTESIVSGQGTAGVTVAPVVPTTYGLSVANAAGCTLDTSIQVNVFNFTPPLTVSPVLDTVILGESVQLMATDNPGYVYQWMPPLYLDAVDVPDPIATPADDVAYTLVIRDPNGCINSALVRLVVLERECAPPFIFVPNAFSPNDDQRNDLLLVEGNNIEELYFAIYDRWGERVFETRDPGVGWDGTFRGRALAPDAYGYLLEVRCVGGETYTAKGNVTLLR